MLKYIRKKEGNKMLSIIILEDDALQRHRVGRLLDEAVEESKAVVNDITFFENGQELLDADRGSGKSMIYLLDIDLKNQTKQGLDIGDSKRRLEGTNCFCNSLLGVYAFDFSL